MRIRTRVLVVVVAVAALLAPATLAQAASPRALSVDVYASEVFPVVDGYQDSVVIAGAVDPFETQERIRGAVVISVGNRVIRQFALSTTGFFTLNWDGTAGNGSIVPGQATVSVRVDGQTSEADTIMISAKKLVKVTRVTTQSPWISMNCRDNRLDHITGNAWFAYFEKICATPRDSRQTILRLTLRGKVSDGPVVYDGHQNATGPSAIDRSPYPPITSITTTFRQSGSGSNTFYLCVDSMCSPPSSPTLQTFTRSGTYTSTGSAISASYPTWRVVVPRGHDLSFSKITIKTVYWVLK